MEIVATNPPAATQEPPKPGRSWNQALVQARLLTALHRLSGSSFAVLPSLTLIVEGEELTPDLSLFVGVVERMKHDVAATPDLPLAVVLILSSNRAFDAQVQVAEVYLAAGVRSCWLVEPTLRTIFVTNTRGVYQSFDRFQTLYDPATSIELELAPLFR